MGLVPVTWQDMMAFVAVRKRGEMPPPWQIELLCDLDAIYLSKYHSKENRPKGLTSMNSVAAFDRMEKQLVPKKILERQKR